MATRPSGDSSFKAAADRHMQALAHATEIQNRALRSLRPDRLAARIKPYIAISRQIGTRGSEVARRIGETLGWEVLDESLLDRIAERFGLSRNMLEFVDEKKPTWIVDVLWTWFDRHVIPQEKFVVQLSRVVLSEARSRSVVLVGRGTQFLLPRDKGFTVGIMAPLAHRVRYLMEQTGASEAEARRRIAEGEAGRRDFVRRYFHHDIDDPALFDLVVQMDRIDEETAADTIVRAFRGVFPGKKS